MPHRRSDDDATKLTPIYSDEPIAVTSPRAKLQKILILYALLPLVTGAIGAYIATKVAYQQSTAHTDARFAVLERDRAARIAASQADNARRDAAQAQAHVLICVALDHLQPRDEAVEAARAQYGCTGGQGVTGSPGASPTAPSGSSGSSGGGSGLGGASPRAGPAPPAPQRGQAAPGPQPAPRPGPSPLTLGPRLPTLGPVTPPVAAPQPAPAPSPTHLLCILTLCLG